MIVNVDVYTKNIDAALAVFKLAVENGATNVRLVSNEDWETKLFENLNLMFEADHTSVAISSLDDGLFAKDSEEL